MELLKLHEAVRRSIRSSRATPLVIWIWRKARQFMRSSKPPKWWLSGG